MYYDYGSLKISNLSTMYVFNKWSLIFQEEVYDATTKCLIQSVTEGYNATVFAYGATGQYKFAIMSFLLCCSWFHDQQ